MARILAIEADPQRGRLLSRLIQEHVKADLTIVASVSAAITAIARQPPDLILAPPLLSPQDSTELTSHVRVHAAPDMEMLTIAALDMLIDAPMEEPRGLSIFTRRPVTLGRLYDPGMLAREIAEGLDRACAARARREAALGHAQWHEAAVQSKSEIVPALVAPGIEALFRQQDEERRRARRNAPEDVPWLSAITLPWGLDLHLVNISSSGLLVESGSRFTPGITYDLQLNGPGTDLSVKARFVRSEVARVDGLGVTYYAAAAFDKELDLLVGRDKTVRSPSPQQALTDLLSTVLAESDHGEPARIRFARGLCRLVRAQDVLVRNAPIAPAHGTESFYFHVKGEGPSRAILQVVFAADHDVTASDFKLLKAAASLTAALLEFEEPLGRTRSLPDEQVAEVA
jgi:CheY-like chemotaxis protein